MNFFLDTLIVTKNNLTFIAPIANIYLLHEFLLLSMADFPAKRSELSIYCFDAKPDFISYLLSDRISINLLSVFINGLIKVIF